ncbi:hypothetical protein [Seonamhaeicola marinus]|uniref:Lipocalin-like domain-containing protein n=1 Tax=Seonamhaeicola marinus TaxID=1912246 RepID=A0A5D0HSQ2_9FLAO|nr:hypothetical protein [Seonamhaeicola marinus]TYA74295.1 hypothetical protein FUA24_13275 [Seonamhaeicola marinus]
MKTNFKEVMKHIKLISILSILVYLVTSCVSTENPLHGTWVFVKGNSNKKSTFVFEKNREKVFTKDMSFYVSNEDAVGKQVTIQGKYKIIDKSHYKEELGNGVYAIYEFRIKNDTLKFGGDLHLPSEKEGEIKTVFVSETWVRKKE